MNEQISLDLNEELKVFEGKIDKNKDLMVEINLAEAPMFSFAKTKKNYLVKDLLNDKYTSKEAKKVLDGIYKNNDLAKVDYRQWIDSKGMNREMIISSSRSFPDSYAMDVFFGLIALLIKDNSPLVPDENGFFKFKSNSIKFTLNELCEAMEIKVGGKTYDKIREALRQLKSAEYYSLGKGTIYNKKTERHEVKGENAVSILESYSVSSRTADEETGRMKFYNGEVKFGSLIMTNLELGFARVLRNHHYFKLKSGVGRGLYLYIESNRNSRDKYIKRSFDVLKNKIPVEFEYPSRLKAKLKKSLDSMIEMGIITDYFYGDEILINGVKDFSLYIIFKGTKKQIIESLTEKSINPKQDKKKSLESDYELVFPEDIKKELIDLGINSKKVDEIIRKYSKWKLAEYILWIKDGIKNGKVKDKAGLFVFAITDEMVKVKASHPHIVEFVNKVKLEVEGKNEIDLKLINAAYDEYINIELEEFKKENEFIYDSLRDTILDDIKSARLKKIKSQKQLYNMATSEKDKEKLLKVIEKWERFSIEGENSELFTEHFIKKIKEFRGLKDFAEFKREYIEKNK